MSDLFQFDPMVSLNWLIPFMVFITVYFGWRESRKPYRFRWLRVASQSLAMIALLGLVLRPSYSSRETTPSLMVLTKNYSTRTVDSLLSAHGDLIAVVAPDAVPRIGTASIRSYRELQKKGRVWFVVGDGIPISECDALNEESFVYFPGSFPNGIVELQVSLFQESRKSRLRGTVRDMKNAALTLRGPGGVEDSVRIGKNGFEKFELAFTTKRTGQYVYDLTVRDSTGSTVSEVVPIEVVPSRKLSILLLQTYPQAEGRFLKNYLASNGHFLVTRYQLSKNTLRYEFANGTAEKFKTLSGQVLQSYDLVLADEESMHRLTDVEAGELERSVRGGLGLLLLLQRPPDGKRFPGNVLDLILDQGAPDTIRYSVPGFGTFVSPFVAMRTKLSGTLQPVMTSGQRMLSGFMLQGEGKIGFQSLRETYRLSLGGETESYAALWTPLLEQVARREDFGISARTATQFPVFPDEPIRVEVLGSDPISVNTNSGARIPLTEDVRVDDLWHGTIWGDEPGWTALSVGGNTLRLNVFISRPGSWEGLRRSNQRHANEQIAVSSGKTVSDSWVVKESVSPWIFFVLFLVATGIVWLAPKV